MDHLTGNEAVNIRPAVTTEFEALSALALRSKALWGYSAKFLAACADELAVRPGETIRYFVADCDGKTLGFYGLQTVDDGAELDGLFVDPEAIGHGTGRRLLEHAIDTACRDGARRLVVQSDPNAEGFYRSAGARVVGTRPSGSIPGRELPLLQFDLEKPA